MINFKDEIKKYNKILEVDEIEESIQSSELRDIMDMLNYIAKEKDKQIFMNDNYTNRR